MQAVVVFGATGNVGRYLVRRLCESMADMRIVAVGRHCPAWLAETRAEYASADVTDKASLASLPQSGVFAVVNFAGVLPAYMPGYDPNAYIRVNTEGMLNVLEYARVTGADRVVYSQSVSRYLGYLADGIREFKPEMPYRINYANDHSVYIISKIAAAELLRHYHLQYGIGAFELVLPNIYLYDPATTYCVDGAERVIAYRYMIRRAMAGEDIELWGDETKGVDLAYVKDLCQLVELTLRTGRREGSYNAGSGRLTPMREYLETICDVFSPPNRRSRIIPRPDKPDCADFMMNIDSAKAELGYAPQYDCRRFLEDYKAEMQKDGNG